MSILVPARREIKSVIIFHPSFVRQIANPAFGHGVFRTVPATPAEAYARFIAETFTREEKTIADRFNVTLTEARELLADEKDAMAEMEFARLQAWDEVNEASDEDAMLAAMARDYDLESEGNYSPGFADSLCSIVEADGGLDYNPADLDPQDDSYDSGCFDEREEEAVQATDAPAPKGRRKKVNAAKARRMASKGGVR